MNVLVVDIGGTHVKVLATGQDSDRKFVSGRTLTPKRMVSKVRKLVADWKYDVVSIGYLYGIKEGAWSNEEDCVLEEILPDLDQVLVMTVNAGFGHQHFLRSTLPKIGRVRRLLEQSKPECRVEADGGIDPETAPLAVAAGANVLVAGTSIFGNSQGVAAAMQNLQSAANDATNEIQT